ncbi:MAG: hypothetical protein COZ43_04120 [Sphingomonadales bacterium CG_4_10_14_3_um_filter_58_15]|nr:MAG: hypothetical protein COZ43_04120 [Sphingomonadales bacterium CG_4_10_14_3_um_filter_58_15]
MEFSFHLKRRAGASAPLAIAPIRRGGQSALPRFARYHSHQTERSEASATARPNLCEESQAGGCLRPAPEVQ